MSEPKAKETIEMHETEHEIQKVPVIWAPTAMLMFNNYNELQQLWQDKNNSDITEWRKVPTTIFEAQKTYGMPLI